MSNRATFEESMNIYAPSGTPVRFIGCTPEQVRFGNCDSPQGLLTIGETYIVEYTRVHSWHTKVKLRGIGGRFNSACFSKV